MRIIQLFYDEVFHTGSFQIHDFQNKLLRRRPIAFPTRLNFVTYINEKVCVVEKKNDNLHEFRTQEDIYAMKYANVIYALLTYSKIKSSLSLERLVNSKNAVIREYTSEYQNI